MSSFCRENTLKKGKIATHAINKVLKSTVSWGHLLVPWGKLRTSACPLRLPLRKTKCLPVSWFEAQTLWVRLIFLHSPESLVPSDPLSHLITLLVEGERLFKILYAWKTDQAVCLWYHTYVSTMWQNGHLQVCAFSPCGDMSLNAKLLPSEINYQSHRQQQLQKEALRL